MFEDGVEADDFYTPGEGLGGIRVRAVRQSDNQTFKTTTFASGGYALPLNSGTYKVTFSGPGLGKSITETVTLDAENVKFDIDTDNASNSSPPTEIATLPDKQIAQFSFEEGQGQTVADSSQAGIDHQARLQGGGELD